MIKNILFPTDFSENAKNAIPFAVDIARKNNAKLFFVHAYDTPLASTSSDFKSGDKTNSLVLEAAEAKMLNFIKISKLNDLPHDYFILEGNTIDQIQETIKQNAIDLVVMGTKGETAKENLFLGSIAKKLIQELPCPVLAIPGDYVFDTIEQIVYATDLKEDDKKIIDYLVLVAELYKSTLTILHLDKNPEAEATHVGKLMKLISKTGYAKIHFKVVVVEDVLDGLEAYVQENHSNILAMTTKTTTLIDDVFQRDPAKKIIFHTHIPILAFNTAHKNKIHF